MHELLARLVATGQPDAVALVTPEGQLTRSELVAHVEAAAAVLQQSGVTRLAIHLDNGRDWVLTDLACQVAGVVCVPLPLYFTQQQMLHALHACGIDALLTVTPARFGVHFPQHVGLPGIKPALLLQPWGHQPALPKGTAKVTFTSGSTGSPRGVCLSARQQWEQAQRLVQAVNLAEPRHLCVLPLPTLLENLAGVYAPLLAGGTVTVPTLAALGFMGSRLGDPAAFLRTIASAQPDTLILIPQLLQLLVQARRQGWQAPFLRFVAVGGARVSASLIKEARALGLPVYEGYGLSECASVVSLNTAAHDLPGSCGQPLPGLEVGLVDGEVQVRGNAMLGYLDDPASWYRERIATGDLGWLDAGGFLHIEGRSKHLLISSYGRNISPEWVESELLVAPQLAEAVVFGDEQPYCVALLSPRHPDLGDDMLQQAVDAANSRLPDYAQIRAWQRLPRPLATDTELCTPNGRPRRARIASVYQSLLASLYADTALA